MTVGQKMHQTLASLESARADLSSFALDTQDQTAKQAFNNAANQLDSIVNTLKSRINYVEQQEPQYKVRQQQNKQQQ
ncbi:MAG: DUF1657 domain-containing protein [bacterium]|jgi:hypothetical protein|nr:DUF1657 domain-containing protein [Bacillota bacterium]HHW55822.1 DUF1657 domain-containing protein [Bacillota bacterium]